MSWNNDLLQRFGQATQPDSRASVRVKRQLLSPQADPIVRALLRDLPQPRVGAQDRVRRRLFSPSPAPARLWLPMGALAAAAAAALGLVLLSQPASPQHLALDSSASSATLSADQHVTLSYQGSGSVSSLERRHDISWEQGTLRVQVSPDQGEQVVVSTPEATVSVVGTVFEVHRDRLGTQVSVQRGQVQVQCGEQAPFALLPDQAAPICLPINAGGLLGRALALEEQSSWTEVLEATQQGLSLQPDPGYAAQLDELRLAAHRELAAAPLSAEGAAGCPAALPHLQALARADALKGDEAAWLAECAR